MKELNIYLIAILIALLVAACSSESGSESGASNGTLSGSYANLLTIDNRLYAVTDSELLTFDVTEAKNPTELDRLQLNFGVESLFYRSGQLFVGSQTTMYIYQLDDNRIPVLASETRYGNFDNFTACDPIVAVEDIAYVTLSSDIQSTSCGQTFTRQINELRVYDIADIRSPNLINVIQMSGPKGLAVDDNWLFVCEKDRGLKVYDITIMEAPQQIHHFDGFKAFDVIPVDGLLLVVGPDNLYQFDYQDMPNMSEISSLSL